MKNVNQTISTNQAALQRSKILSVGVNFPDDIVKSDDLMAEIKSDFQYGIRTDWLRTTMGIDERRVASTDLAPSALAMPAARRALRSATEISPQDIDMVVFCGIERDCPEPATAHTIQNQLGLKARYAFDISNACFGFMDAMQMVNCYIASGVVRHALVVTGEVPTRVMLAAVDKLKKGVHIKTARNIIGALSVGDAGGAVVIGPAKKSEISGFDLFNTVSFSQYVKECQYKQLDDGTFEGHMIMGKLAGAFIRCHNRLIDGTLDKLGWTSFDWMLSHQIGQKPFERLSKMNGVRPERMVKTLDKFGNITSATFPVNFHKLVSSENVQSGDKIGGCFAGSGIVIGQLGYTF